MPHPLICFDNAVVRIGFEVPRYTYIEPEFDKVIDATFEPPTNLTVNGPIYLAKEDNVQSEQTFRIVVQVTESVPSGDSINPARIEDDYSIGSGRRTDVEFLPHLQKVNFQFTLFPDNLPEGTEAFHANSSAEHHATVDGETFDLPGYLPPVNLSAGTFAIIEDNVCKSRYGIHYCE